MNIKRVLIGLLIIIAVVVSVSAVSAGLFDGLFGEEQKDNVIEIDDFTFNTTNGTDFIKFDKPSEEEYMEITCYQSDNGTGNYILVIIDYSKMAELDDTVDEQIEKELLKGMNDSPYQIVNGIVIYPSAPVYHEDVDVKQMFSASVQNEESHQLIMLSSPDANETAKMASTLKFK